MKKLMALVLVLVFILSFAGCNNISLPEQVTEDFSFSLTWGAESTNSYDSTTGKMVKTFTGSETEDYTTYYELTTEQKELIYSHIKQLDLNSYPDIYDPHENGKKSKPPMTLILTVRKGEKEKTIKAEKIAYVYEAENEKGQKFLSTCKAIHEILETTNEWQSLPDHPALD